eukprot:357066_1
MLKTLRALKLSPLIRVFESAAGLFLRASETVQEVAFVVVVVILFIMTLLPCIKLLIWCCAYAFLHSSLASESTRIWWVMFSCECETVSGVLDNCDEMVDMLVEEEWVCSYPGALAYALSEMFPRIPPFVGYVFFGLIAPFTDAILFHNLRIEMQLLERSYRIGIPFLIVSASRGLVLNSVVFCTALMACEADNFISQNREFVRSCVRKASHGLHSIWRKLQFRENISAVQTSLEVLHESNPVLPYDVIDHVFVFLNGDTATCSTEQVPEYGLPTHPNVSNQQNLRRTYLLDLDPAEIV